MKTPAPKNPPRRADPDTPAKKPRASKPTKGRTGELPIVPVPAKTRTPRKVAPAPQPDSAPKAPTKRKVRPQQLTFEPPRTLPDLTFGLSLYPPWSDWLIEGVKDIENRPFAPRPEVIGKYIVIHATKNVPPEERVQGKALRDICKRTGAKPVPNPVYGAVIGIVRVVGYVVPPAFPILPPNPATRSPWFTGPAGWLIEGARRLKTPIVLNGARRLWRTPLHVIEAIVKEFPDLAWTPDDRARWVASRPTPPASVPTESPSP